MNVVEDVTVTSENSKERRFYVVICFILFDCNSINLPFNAYRFSCSVYLYASLLPVRWFSRGNRKTLEK